MEERLRKGAISEDRKLKQLTGIGKKESEFLRLRRVKLGVDDFITVKVIGKGAFGEVKNWGQVGGGGGRNSKWQLSAPPPYLGTPCSKGRHWQDFCNEDVKEI